MSYRPPSYPASFIMRSTDPSTLRIIDLWTFRSSKSHKRYIVEVERFSNHFFGIKFFWKAVEQSLNRYSLLTHDFEPRTIVMSCIQIMLHYFENDSFASFGFVAANDITNDTPPGMPNKRFKFYRRMMLTMFSPDKFIQGSDIKNSIYLLINKRMLELGRITFPQIEAELNQMYIGDYALSPTE